MIFALHLPPGFAPFPADKEKVKVACWIWRYSETECRLLQAGRRPRGWDNWRHHSETLVSFCSAPQPAQPSIESTGTSALTSRQELIDVQPQARRDFVNCAKYLDFVFFLLPPGISTTSMYLVWDRDRHLVRSACIAPVPAPSSIATCTSSHWVDMWID